MKDLIELEERGWQALSSNNPGPFCETWLGDEVVIVVPGMVITRDQFLFSIEQEEPWSSYSIDDPRTIRFTEDCSAVLYKVTARRETQSPYTALITSVYARHENEWKLIYHQQTPEP